MKKLLLSACVALTAGTALAQWSTDLTSPLAVSGTERMGASLPKVHQCQDGKIWVAWLNWQDGMNGYIKAQLLDTDGKELLEPGGIYVSKHITASWTSNFDMQVTPEGDCIVCHSDSRNDPEARQTFTPFIYKINQEGDFLWGLDGIELPTTDGSGHRPKIGITKEGTVMVGYNDVIREPDGMQYQIMKINNDGTLAWPKPMPMDGSFGVFMPCDDDDLYLSIIAGGGIQLYRMDSLGDMVWDAPVMVEDRDPNTRSECVPISDGNGGVFMSYQRYINLSNIRACLQHITADGETSFGLQGIDISEEPGTHSFAGVACNSQRDEVAAYWSWRYGENEHLMVQKYNYYGDPVWDEPMEIDSHRIFGYAAAEGTILDDGSIVMLYGAYQGAIKLNLMVTKLDKDGNLLWSKQLGKQAYVNQPFPIYNGENAYIFWSDNLLSGGSSPYDTIWGQYINLADGTATPSSVQQIATEGAGEITFAEGSLSVNPENDATVDVFDAAGARVASYDVQAGANSISLSLDKGLYIVRLNDGQNVKTAKIML